MLLGIDLGTSSVKCLLTSLDGSTQYAAEREYPILYPHTGYAEQDPETWWLKTCEAVRDLTKKSDPKQIRAVGLSGQMHGTVLVGRSLEAIVPTVIWADKRSQKQCKHIHEQIDNLATITGSGAFTGFMLPTLMWVKEHQPHVWQQTKYAIFPKDYIRLKLTDEPAIEPTDACSGLILDIKSRKYASSMLAQLGIDTSILPPLIETTHAAGHLTAASADKLGLPAGIPVFAGAADQVTSLMSAGAVSPGMLSISLGTGGTLIAPAAQLLTDPQLRLHTFCNAQPGTWYVLGALLASGLSFRWLRDSVFGFMGQNAFEHMSQLAENIPIEANKLLFLPYLAGERLANQESNTRGVFFGLTPEHSQGHLARAVMEGTAFAFRRMLDVMKDCGVKPDRLIASGGGLRSRTWQQITADVLGLPITSADVAEQSALGAAMLAGVGCGAYTSNMEAVEMLVRYKDTIDPIESNLHQYDQLYSVFCSIYDHLQPDFDMLADG